MITMDKYDVSYPEYTDNVAKVAAMFKQAEGVTDCVTIYGALVAIRTNLIVVETDDTGKDAPKGNNSAARELGISNGAMSKGVTVVLAECPNLIDAEASEIRDRVRAFLVDLEAQGKTLTSVYKSLSATRQGEGEGEGEGNEGEDAPEFDQAKAVALFATAIAYATKYDQDAVALFNSAMGK